MTLRHLMFLMAAAGALQGCQSINAITGLGGTSAADGGAGRLPAATPPAAGAAAPVRSPGARAASAERLLSQWGEPALRRRETGAELWQYGGGRTGCTILVYLYPEGDGSMKVARIEALPGGASDEAVASCAKAQGLGPVS